MTADPAGRWGVVPGRVRASDADRAHVTSALAEHYAHGRLDDEEFDQRSTRALSAVYVDELDGLFHDLPPVRPPQPAPRTAPRPTPVRRPSAPRRPPVAMMVLLAVALVVLTRGAALWLVPLLWMMAGSARSCARRQYPSGTVRRWSDSAGARSIAVRG